MIDYHCIGRIAQPPGASCRRRQLVPGKYLQKCRRNATRRLSQRAALSGDLGCCCPVFGPGTAWGSEGPHQPYQRFGYLGSQVRRPGCPSEWLRQTNRNQPGTGASRSKWLRWRGRGQIKSVHGSWEDSRSLVPRSLYASRANHYISPRGP